LKRVSGRTKNTLLVFGVIAALLAVGLGASTAARLATKTPSNRVYQHETLQEPDEGTYQATESNTKLPIVRISTNGQTIPGEVIATEDGSTIGYTLAADGDNYITAQMDVFDTSGAYNHLTDTPAISSAIKLRIRGNSSRHFDKKSYKIMLINDDATEKKMSVMGMSKHDEWALYGPFLDKTLIRNYLFLNLYGERDPATPDVRFCEVYLDGEYQGLYVMMETIAQGNGRIDLASYTTRSDATSYIVRLDRQWDEPDEISTFTHYTLNQEYKSTMAVVYPARLHLTETFKTYITNDISQFEKALYSYDFDNREKGWRAYIDMQSFVDYYVISEFLGINDMCSRSTYMYKDLGGKLYMGPGWDFNNAADNFFSLSLGEKGFHFVDRTWYSMLLKDPEFVKCVVETYQEMREEGNIFNEERLMTLIDDTVSFLGNAVERNFTVWGYSFDPENLNNYNQLRPLERNITSFPQGIKQLKTYLVKRGQWMDENIETLYQYCDQSKNKQYYD
jgi:spore coat protein H